MIWKSFPVNFRPYWYFEYDKWNFFWRQLIDDFNNVKAEIDKDNLNIKINVSGMNDTINKIWQIWGVK